MPWARIAPNLAMTSSCLSLMTLEYSCLNWLTWRNKKRNYGLFICCATEEHPVNWANDTETQFSLISRHLEEGDGPDVKADHWDQCSDFLCGSTGYSQSSLHRGRFRLKGVLTKTSLCTSQSAGPQSSQTLELQLCRFPNRHGPSVLP